MKIKRPKQTFHRAFTLIELLVVIAIIAVLAAILLPALSKAKMSSDTAVCRNNLRQMGVALRLYLDDGGVYPGPAPNDYLGSWWSLLEPYAKERWPDGDSGGRGIFACPGYNRISGKYRRPEYTLINAGSGAYGYNFSETFYGIPSRQCRGLGGFTGPSTGLGKPLKEERVVAPSEMIALADSILFGGGSDYAKIGPGYIFVSYDALSDPLFVGGSDKKSLDGPRALYYRRHNNRFASLFCDGHVDAVKVADLFDAKRPEVRRRWNFDNQP